MHALGRQVRLRGKRKRLRKRRGKQRLLRRRIPRRQEPMEAEAAPSAQPEAISQPYNQGYDHGYDKGHDAGFGKGLYAGGEGLVDQLLPNGMILPEIPIQSILAAGINSMQSQLYPIHGTAAVMEAMMSAMDGRKPFSIVRLGDGELLTMAQGDLMTIEQVREQGGFLPYAGIEIPDPEAKRLLLDAVKGADFVGIPLLRMPNFQHLAFSVFRANGMDYRAMNLTHSTINYAIYLEHWFSRMVAGRKVLTVGNKAVPLAGYLREHGVNVIDAVSPVHGMKDVPRVMAEIAARDFELALVSAGVSAVVIAHKIAAELGKTAIDFGHLADSMVNGEAPFA